MPADLSVCEKHSNAHTYNVSFHFFFFFKGGVGGEWYRRRDECIFMGKEGARFEVVY